MTSVRLDRIRKSFGATVAAAEVCIEIGAGELFFLLGPSGCGKSTLLRIVAGLLAPDSGRVIFGERDVTKLSTENRNAVMCFQSYALWPHMSVAENIRFGLDVRNLPRDQQNHRVAEVLNLVRMSDLADRKPNELSGGQQQRVALARALAVEPACLLLDEPLSNLDAQLRGEMRSEIRRICKTSGLTTLYVTHDQKEALSIADRIAIMKNGAIEQIGSPDELYNHPSSAFVAKFIGDTNLLSGTVINTDAEIETSVGKLRAICSSALAVSRSVQVSIRPEQIRLVREGFGARGNRLAGTIVESIFLGESSEHILQIRGQKLKMLCTPPMFDLHGEVAVEIDPKDVVILNSP